MPVTRMARAVKTKNKAKRAAGPAKGSKGIKGPKAGPRSGKPQDQLANQDRLANDGRLADEQRNALALNSINESVYDWNVETDEVYFSPSLRVMLGDAMLARPAPLAASGAVTEFGFKALRLAPE